LRFSAWGKLKQNAKKEQAEKNGCLDKVSWDFILGPLSG